MKSKGFVDVEVGVDGVQKFDLDVKGRSGAPRQAVASCWPAVATLGQQRPAVVRPWLATAWIRLARGWLDAAVGG